ncbi:MAG TPA: tol-pal system protein YbgF [Xanthobacteraceae bacterium]|nr:tol-pal system protein YbgF [Xanthobacteraceae bacterium]
MIRLPPGALGILLVAGALVATSATTASAQSNGDQSPGFLGGLFGGDQGSRRDQAAQPSADELSVRVDRLEAQVRQMTGMIEELQFQLRRLQGDAGAQASNVQQSMVQPPAGQSSVPQPAVAIGPRSGAAPPPGPNARRGDAFDPSQNPNAPGAPRTLGTVAVGPGSAGGNPSPNPVAVEEGPGVGGRGTGEPLNLSNMSANASPNAGNPPSGGAGGDGRGTQLATLPPSDSPKDYYDLASGYMLRKDYALATDAFRAFLGKFPSDRMAPEAEYWLGESLFQRQQYRDAAEAFLNVSTKYESTPRAPDSLLRLGQSLAFLGEKEAACASLGEVLRKYPRAKIALKEQVDREQKRDGC